MQRCGKGFILLLAVLFLLLLNGCLGKSTSSPGSGGVSSVTLTPTGSGSVDVGGTLVFSAIGRNASGGTILSTDVRFIVQSATPNSAPPLSVASNGNGCAGTWDATVAICTPGVPGIALVTAVINGVSSAPTTVYIHQHIDSIQIKNFQDPAYPYDCFPQGTTWQYEAVAFSNNVDISNTVGPMTWSTSNTGVVTTAATLSGTPGNQVNLVQTTAKTPGITRIFASVGGTQSNPLPYTTCLVKAIYLQIGGQSSAGNTITVNGGTAVPVTAIVIDSLYGVADFAPLTSPPLTWSTSNPEIAAFSTTTNASGTNSATTRNNPGGAVITASCTPPTCNIGLPGPDPSGTIVPSLPVYASNCHGVSTLPCPLPGGTVGYGAISVDVTTTSTTPPAYTAWAATTGCNDHSGCSSALFSLATGTTPIGTILTLPRTPNSMLFNHLATPRLYLGSDQGLMYVDSSGSPTVTEVSSSPSPCKISLCGKVLTISNDGNLVVISDTVSTPSQVYIYDGGSTTTAPVDLIIPGQTATAAAFSPDQLKLFILTNTGMMYVYSTVDALTAVPSIANTVTDVKFSADGSFAYVAGTPTGSVSAYSTCSQPSVASINLDSVAVSSTPLEIFPFPNVTADPLGLTQNILALEPPNVEMLTASDFAQVPVEYQSPMQFTCNPPTIQSFTKGASYNLGQGSFVPVYSALVADGNEFIVVAQKVPAVLLFNVANGTTTSVPLANNADPIAAAASPDGSQVFVAACDQYDLTVTPPVCAVGSVHIVNTQTQGDIQQVPYINAGNNNDRNMCSNGGNPAPQCLPNLVAVKPQ